MNYLHGYILSCPGALLTLNDLTILFNSPTVSGCNEMHSERELLKKSLGNIRSLAKNFELLHDLLYCFDNIPDVFAVTETRINCNSSANIDFPNYKFYSTDSKTMAGGVGIYISSSLNAIHRSDLSFNSVGAEYIE